MNKKIHQNIKGLMLCGMMVVQLGALGWSVPAHADLKFDSDVAAPLKKQILDDVQFIQSISSQSNSIQSTPMHEKVFGKVDGPNYFKWLNARVFSVGFDDCGSPNAVACVIPFRSNTKIWMTNNYVKFSHPQIARLSVIYHEARHTEVQNGNWSHATCPTPFKNEQGQDVRSIWTGALLAGEPACDVTAFGSYGSATIFLKNISKFCVNCSEKVRMDAGMYADDQIGRITDPASKNAMIQDFKTGNSFRRTVARRMPAAIE